MLRNEFIVQVLPQMRFSHATHTRRFICIQIAHVCWTHLVDGRNGRRYFFFETRKCKFSNLHSFFFSLLHIFMRVTIRFFFKCMLTVSAYLIRILRVLIFSLASWLFSTIQFIASAIFFASFFQFLFRYFAAFFFFSFDFGRIVDRNCWFILHF